MLNKLLLSACLLLVLASCEKKETTAGIPQRAVIDLQIINTTTPATQTQKQDIVSQVRCIEKNGCEKFSTIEIHKTGTNEYEIRAKGTVPNLPTADYFCTQVITYKDSTVKVNAATKGKYLLRFYNQQQLV